ncbi:MAG: NAD-dependent succinate-semialdehyde dehydrogenase [Longimicrobiales bacterium]
MKSVNPATGEEVAVFAGHSAADVEQRLARAAHAFSRHRTSTFEERAAKLNRAADILERESRDWGAIMTLEMGKPFAAAVAEAEKCAKGCRFYAEHGAALLADETRTTDASRSFIRYQPIGVVLAIMPWNFPFWQVFRFAAPTLMAGNVGILKHASNVPQCALGIEDILRRAGFDADEFQTLLVEASAAEAIIADNRIAAVTLTGSEAAGSAVASTAGRHIKKTVLELGGSDPFIVMPSADIDRAIQTAVIARTINNGQSCIAAKRFIVHERIADRFIDGFVAGMKALVVGDPMDERTQIGPLATERILADLDQQVRASVKVGAVLRTGGKRLDRAGWFYEPTVLTDIPENAPAYREELFGPVASVFLAHDIDEAIAIANDSPFGLGSSAWTNDVDEQRTFIDELEAGLVFINAMVASDPRLPFGGIKRSGYGRELDAAGIREFVNIKSVSIL